ncbi:hypothetical protein [Acetobacter oeni]|uniref:Chaperone modulatory protein CbpM n=1 Tax=Acetobacter oeni TaxID=304077 RepID=A0A511XJW2_9PROT|nr:hypothetical protein [Acetobacter oeni]MBB3883466.1 chaperone modulatory protein CbpM [Acetobacter oeni]NHO19436.1 hypothetical protein [Acetobacter oeni]GBR04078.1 hypothetical protein AA21952_1295 [Acetobacter oeni LMG 21952]GEN63247.1 hypothetical protein AOE01nite_14710 [Acetobacter oeni]
MITIETLSVRLGGTSVVEIENWIRLDWLRADGVPGHYLFQDMDEARARLIIELRDELGVEEDALPLVLSLLDQLYAARRQMRLLASALTGDGKAAAAETAGEIRSVLQDIVREHSGGSKN